MQDRIKRSAREGTQFAHESTTVLANGIIDWNAGADNRGGNVDDDPECAKGEIDWERE